MSESLSAGNDERLCRFEISDWAGPIPKAMRDAATTALEQGKVLVFPHLPFSFTAAEAVLYSPALSNGSSKNVSLRPSGSLGGTSLQNDDAAVLAAMMTRFADTAMRFVLELLPHYRDALERAPTSYRPVQISGRAASVVRDDTRLHVDAFPSRPMRGRRILRLFTNVNPNGEARVWRVGERFEDMARQLGTGAKEGSRLHAWILAALGITKGRRSAYDDLMLGLHDAAKRNERYQRECAQEEMRFPPGSTWICYTDQVMHAAMSGQYVLEQTFHLDADAMVNPELSPLKVLERLRGHALV